MKHAGPRSGQQRQHEEFHKQGKPMPGLQYPSVQGPPPLQRLTRGVNVLTQRGNVLSSLHWKHSSAANVIHFAVESKHLPHCPHLQRLGCIAR